MADDELLLMAEVAEMARQPLDTLRYRRQQGLAPHGFRLGKKVVYRRSDVLAWIQAAATADSAPNGAA